ncbi:MAG TPA: alkaline phosphatase family protein [Ktedonobacterales bacterium]|nr:alkaline phosphatase family protein [Ktedonobacterales bacterium]
MSATSRNGRAPRVLVIGLDGATFRWITPLVESGRLPTLARLMREGASGPLESIIPPHTGPAWPSMITGRNPGKHGIFYFEKYDVAKYACLDGIATAEPLVGRTIFDIASAGGQRVAALRVPMTFPAWPVNGVMASGYPAPGETDRYAYPTTLASVLPPMAAIRIHGNTPEGTFTHMQREIEVLTTAACQLLTTDQYDLFMVVYQQTDQAHHFFWRYVDPASPLYQEREAKLYGDLIARCYEAVDAAAARLLEFAGDETLVLLVSDHGAECAPATYFQTNRWLADIDLLHATPHAAEAGLRRLFDLRHAVSKDLRVKVRKLVMRSSVNGLRSVVNLLGQDSLGIDWSRTAAYRFPVTEQMEGIAINLRGRQPQGIVEPGTEYEQLLERLTKELGRLREPGTDRPLVVEVHRRDEVFWGPHAHRAPDLFYRLAPGFESRGEVTGPRFTPVPAVALERHNAWHDRAGVLMARGPAVVARKRIVGAHLLDIAPTILRTLGLPLSGELDGTPLQACLGTVTPTDADLPLPVDRMESAFAADADRSPEDNIPLPVSASQLSDEEEESIKGRLRALGYL